jgi:uncharacterized protein YacL
MNITMSAELISAIVAFVLSFLVEKVTGFKDWWAKFKHKELMVAGMGIVVVIVLIVLEYFGAPIGGVPEPFIWEGLFAAISMWIAFIVASQSAYMIQKDNLPRKNGKE